MPKFDTLVFDFGNVLIDLDLEATWRQLSDLLGADGLASAKATTVFDDYEVGTLQDETFLNRLQRHATGKVPTGRQLMDAWNAMLLGIPKHRFEFLYELRRADYRVFLLSNTNAMHIAWVDQYLRSEYGSSIPEFGSHYFDAAYYSHLIGHRKPNRACYDWVATAAELDLGTTLFIDDNAENIAGAEAAGWHAHLHPIGAEITETLTEILQLDNSAD